MAIKYLGKLRPIDFQSPTSFVQMVNVPELQEHSRCAFCHYFQEGRTSDEFFECSDKRKCGMESLLFVPMVNISKRKPGILNDFTLTPVTKQITVGNDKRYLQLLSSDVQGYECNQLCQYYPARIAAEQSVAECANSHACGRNGSFWDLLTPRYPFLATYPNLKSDIIDQNTFVTIDGRVIKDVELDSIYVDENHYPKAVLSDGSSWYIVNLYWDSPDCGQVLYARKDSEPKLWEWTKQISYFAGASNSLIITDDGQPITQMLIDYGYPDDNLIRPLKDLALIPVSSSGSSWFVNDSSYFEEVATKSYRIIVITSYLKGNKYIISFGDQAQTYLGTKFPNDPPSKWARVSPADFAPKDYHVITLNSYTDAMAKWLMRIGVRQSLFFFK